MALQNRKTWTTLFFIGISLVTLSTHSTASTFHTSPLAGLDSNRVEVITITNADSRREVSTLILRLLKSGINVKQKIRYRRRNRSLEQMNFVFRHQRGLNFDLTILGFSKVEFQLLYNEQGLIEYFSYRFNDEVKYNILSLRTQGQKYYAYANNQVVTSYGSSNEITKRIGYTITP